jgi:hypothetical protein
LGEGNPFSELVANYRSVTQSSDRLVHVCLGRQRAISIDVDLSQNFKSAGLPSAESAGKKIQSRLNCESRSGALPQWRKTSIKNPQSFNDNLPAGASLAVYRAVRNQQPFAKNGE